MRSWLPLDETPAWFGSRPVQAFFAACVLGVVAGIGAAFVVRVESPWIRVVSIAVMVPGLLVMVALLRRSERIRRHHARSGRDDRAAGSRA
jgi:uncharacterized membrane protein YjjB (DUF3815 family)